MTDWVSRFISSKDKVLVLVLLLIVSVYNFSYSCQYFTNYSFDNQIPIAWQFTALNDLLPYKHIYYPYGIFFYLKNFIPLMMFFYSVLSVVLLFSVYIFLKKIWKNNFLTYLSFSVFFAFVYQITTINVFNRYGIITAISIMSTFVLYKNTYLNSRVSFLIGFLMGLIFSMVNDQGIYSLVLVTFLITINPIMRNGIYEMTKIKYLISIGKSYICILLGVVIGLGPFMIYLKQNDMFFDFLGYIYQIKDFGVYAKTPFIPYSSSIDNLFIYIPILITIILLTYRIFYKKLSLVTYAELSILVVIILLEQKSIVRSISTQITFISLLLTLLLISEFNHFLKNVGISVRQRIIYFGLLFIIIWAIGLQSNSNFNFRIHEVQNIHRNFNLKQNLKICLDNNLSGSNLGTYNKIKNIINSENDKAVIFDYLSNPIFYPIFNQDPPYYFTIFESTPNYAQEKNIAYIEKNNVEFIIYNPNVTTLADGVPAYARNPVLFRYVINNFEIYKKIDEFIILKKRKNEKFILNNELKKIPEFRDFLMNVDFAGIPRSEGFYKLELLLNKGKSLIKSRNTDQINSFLKNNQVNSRDKFVVLTPDNSEITDTQTKLIFKTDEGYQSSVLFYSCKNKSSCIINISRIPLFYKNSRMLELRPEKNFIGTIEIISLSNADKLW